MLELFTWAYARFCGQYGVAKTSLGEIDAFRIQYRQQRKAVMGKIIKENLHGKNTESFIATFCREQSIEDVDKFTAMTLADLSVLHAGALVGLGVPESQLNAWLSDEM